LSEDHAISELKPYGNALACALALCCGFSSRRFLFNTLLAANSNLFAFSLLAHHLPFEQRQRRELHRVLLRSRLIIKER
jgi:hypothetical protein